MKLILDTAEEAREFEADSFTEFKMRFPGHGATRWGEIYSEEDGRFSVLVNENNALTYTAWTLKKADAAGKIASDLADKLVEKTLLTAEEAGAIKDVASIPIKT